MLPVQQTRSIVSLGEGWTPLIRINQEQQILPVKELWVKREEQNPTASFKARGFSTAISLLNEHGVKKVAVPSNGNAASALAAYAAHAGMQSYVFVPQDCPEMIIDECLYYGAHTYKVDGYIHDAARIIQDGSVEQGWFNVGTLREPGRVEGKKTMGFELAEQMNWILPDVIVYPTGGGSGIIGLWKAFHELKSLGMLSGDLPRFVSVQEAGCQPIVDAIRSQTNYKPFPPEKVTASPTGMRVPEPPAGSLIVSILRETDGTAVAVDRDEIRAAQIAMGAQGISASPEGSATLAGTIRLIESGWIGRNERVVLFNTSHAIKYWPYTSSSSVPIVKNYEEWVRLTSPQLKEGAMK
ncbi:threonine synthase [Effusibacillus dendaii]|uniref:Threonine synthase n=2 Tax=Effusibacillus dendaii TaxID=2743772 RepID=A0A7I8D9R2_9BACL|nr:threonine synthase [Effusibacillus dendaii]